MNHSLSMLPNTSPDPSGVTAALCARATCGGTGGAGDEQHEGGWCAACMRTGMEKVEAVSVCVNLCRKSVCCLFFFLSCLFCLQNKKETDGDNTINPPCSAALCLNSSVIITSTVSESHVMAGQVRVIYTGQQQKGSFYLAGCERKNLNKNHLVRKHGERESSSRKFTQNRKENVSFFLLFLECWLHNMTVSVTDCVSDISLCH